MRAHLLLLLVAVALVGSLTSAAPVPPSAIEADSSWTHPAAGVEQRTCVSERLERVRTRKDPMRGANLGSWLIQEAWMVTWLWSDHGCDPNVYPGAYLLEQCLGSRAPSVIGHHWRTYVTEADFEMMAKMGLNAVRFPIGWWQIYDPEGGAANATLNYPVQPRNYIVGGLHWIDKAFEWGAKYGIAILLDMHAPPGSQSGNQDSAPPDNTGRIYWDKYPANPAQTADSVELYAKRYAGHPALLGFCLLNEPGNAADPGNINVTIVRNYYVEAYHRIRKHSRDAWVVINPLISPFQTGTEPEWVHFMNPSDGFTNVFVSLHYYHCFGGVPTTDQALINYILKDRLAQIEQYYKVNPKPMLIDEWSDCGVSEGWLEVMIQTQIEVWKRAAGWAFWAWSQTNGGDAWSLKTAFLNKWIWPSQTGIQIC